jgi:hypothetical protein
MFVSGRRGVTTLLQDTPHTLMPAAARQPPHRSWTELSATLDFMLATLVGNGAAWSVATLPAIKVNSHPFRRLVKVRCWALTDVTILVDVRFAPYRPIRNGIGEIMAHFVATIGRSL